MTPFYIQSGHVSLCDQVIGSIINASSCNSSSVVTAFWPAKGSNFIDINYSCKCVGIYFLIHFVTFSVNLALSKGVNIFYLETKASTTGIV